MRRILNGRNRGAVPEVPRVGVGRMSTLRAAREADNKWRGTGGGRGLHQRLKLDCNVDEGVDDSTGVSETVRSTWNGPVVVYTCGMFARLPPVPPSPNSQW